jgi:hypothetical protein
MVAAGTAHTCGLDALGKIRCWGDQFSENSGMDHIVNVDGPYKMVAAGEDFTCAITTGTGGWDQFGYLEVSVHGGQLHCWGYNYDLYTGYYQKFGTWGDDGCSDNWDCNRRIGTVSIGSKFACALTEDDGTPICWGAGGGGIASYPQTPGWTQVSVAYMDNACLLSSVGSLFCWGAQFTNPVTGTNYYTFSDHTYYRATIGGDWLCAQIGLDGEMECRGRYVPTVWSSYSLVNRGVYVNSLSSNSFALCVVSTTDEIACYSNYRDTKFVENDMPALGPAIQDA